MNEKIKTPEQVVSEAETSSIFDEQVFVRKFKDANGGLHEFRFKSMTYRMNNFDESRFKIIVERNGIFFFDYAKDESAGIDKFKVYVFESFQKIDFFQMVISEINSEAINAVFFIRDNEIETEFCSVLHFYKQNQKS